MPTFEVRLEGHAYGGESIGRLPDGRAVFVPLALPGELVRIELVEEKRGFCRARLVEVLEASPDRVEPHCPHFGACGGCHYQHMRYAAQLEAKQAVLRDQLERIGGLRQPRLSEPVSAPQPYNYRNYVQFHLTPEGQLGYHRPRSQEVLAVKECHLPEPLINAVWPRLEFEPGSGIERVGLRLGAEDELLVTLESRNPESPELRVEDLPVSVAHLSPAGALTLAGSPEVTLEVLKRSFRVSAGSFFQVNTAMAERLVEQVIGLLEERGLLGPQTSALDLYCGAGLFSAFLRERVERLVGVEASPSAVEDFAYNLDEFTEVEIYEARVEQALAALDFRPDIALVDPPREGLDRKVVDWIVEAVPQALVYVSCDPATLARDARRLTAGGYRLEEARLFDLFPQTYHIESVSLWTRGETRARGTHV
ncbi:MAG: hypothetical protein B6D39_12525 [Anaerolineae bacterium UTCFX2]|jgi:23S rRNA (uracil1939-C5)-methyltransferase|nr:class I SAM-dependent RNA methyltransferase [Anaerolineales bacterium]OQY87733.1 MAG: hypothetical protein B6D39_12525 [Anaerolineae bacterium UTCFX2]